MGGSGKRVVGRGRWERGGGTRASAPKAQPVQNEVEHLARHSVAFFWIPRRPQLVASLEKRVSALSSLRGEEPSSRPRDLTEVDF